MIKKIIAFLLLNFIVFFCAGKLMFDKRPQITENKITNFLGALENEKVGLYYLNLKKLGKNHEYINLKFISSTEIIKEACYKITPNKLERTAGCKEDIQITLDEHAVGSIFAASHDPEKVIFSEILFNHIKIEGIKLEDFL